MEKKRGGLMKRIISIALLALGMLFVILSSLGILSDSVRSVPLVREGGTMDSITLRFYKEQPNVPYFGMKAYSEAMGVNPLTFEVRDDGKYYFTNEKGAIAVVDPVQGTITADDWCDFFNPVLPYDGAAKALKDSDCGFIRVSDVSYKGECKQLILDLKKYGLKMYADEEDVYLSLSLLSSIMADIATWGIKWNGDKAYFTRNFFNPDIMQDYYESSSMKNMLYKGERKKDIAEESYRELCFIIDNFLGRSGSAPIDGQLFTKGLNQTLLDMGEDGKKLIDKLSSIKTRDYIMGMMELFYMYLYDGHTLPYAATLIFNRDDIPCITTEDKEEIFRLIADTLLNEPSFVVDQIRVQRKDLWGDEPYREYGNTAIIYLKDFVPDEEGWKEFYQNEGEIPKDCVGNTITGLKKASQNPKIKNILFDLTANGGGSSDALAYILSLAVGVDTLYGREQFSGRDLVVTFESDKNLDGVIDEKDKDVVYDQFNYGVLTTKGTFSAGNLFPILMQEAGAVLIGEQTGGGCCCIQMGINPDGTYYIISSKQWQLTDSDYNSVETGCDTDLFIEHEETEIEKSGFKRTEYDYSSYFDEEMLDRMMNEWFEEEVEPAA